MWRCATGSRGRTIISSGRCEAGIDRLVQIGFLEKHHIDEKTDCSRCWARPLCSGGCYHEAHTRYGDTAQANLHYCEWIRGWTETCLKIYAELAVRNPGYLEQFDDEESGLEASRAINRKAARIERKVAAEDDVVALQQGGLRNSRRSRIFRWAARWCFRRDGRRTATAAPPDCARRWSAICSTATPDVSGRRRCRTS